jgi:hypothetical protein
MYLVAALTCNVLQHMQPVTGQQQHFRTNLKNKKVPQSSMADMGEVMRECGGGQRACLQERAKG